MSDIFTEERELQPEVSELWEYANKYAGLENEKRFFLRYVHGNNSLFSEKTTFRYPLAKVKEEDESEREIMMKVEDPEKEEEEEDSRVKIFYPPLREQMERAEKIVEYAREQFGLLQSNMAVVDLAYFIRYCEFGGEWCWNDK